MVRSSFFLLKSFGERVVILMVIEMNRVHLFVVYVSLFLVLLCLGKKSSGHDILYLCDAFLFGVL